ncbi:MAG: hypothetical protein SFX74_10055 [Fimbriimonadaceae bacterium]|nr:hypothetical protein [Fimbriimonadaceae bacterium]
MSRQREPESSRAIGATKRRAPGWDAMDRAVTIACPILCLGALLYSHFERALSLVPTVLVGHGLLIWLAAVLLRPH